MSNTVSLTRSKEQGTQRLLGVLALTIAGLGAVKFCGLMVEWGPANSPWVFLVVLVVPFLVGRWLLGSRPRTAAIVIASFAGLYLTACVVTLANGLEPYWADYLVALVGGPLALVAVGLAVRVIRAA